jgi:hypothetical protein
MQKRISKVSGFVHDYLMETGKDHEEESWGPKYRWQHTLRVAHWAWVLAKEEKTDILFQKTIANTVRKVQKYLLISCRKLGFLKI